MPHGRDRLRLVEARERAAPRPVAAPPAIDIPGLDATGTAALVAALRPRDVAKGSYFSVAGTSANEFGWVERGVLRVVYIDVEGNELTKHFFTEFQWLMSNLELDAAAVVSIQALTPARVWRMAMREAASLLEAYPALALWMNRQLIAYLAVKQRRETALVNQRGLARYAAFRTTFPELEARIPLRIVANHLGMTPTQLSRIRRKLP